MKRVGVIDQRPQRISIEADVPDEAGTASAACSAIGGLRLRSLGMRSRLTIEPHEETLVLRPSSLSSDTVGHLLSTILYQAMNDGMDKIEYQIRPDSDEAFMRYWGPTKYAERFWATECGDNEVAAESKDWPQWWDMHAPPTFVFLPMLRALLLMARFPGKSPKCASLPVRLQGKDWDLRLTLPDAWTFRLSGLEAYFV